MELSTQAELMLDLINLHTRIQKRLLGPLSLHGISLTEFLVLRQLALAPEKKMRRIDLAQQVGLSASGVTRLLDPMQKIGLVNKEETERDARVSLVTLTKTGERILNDACVTFDQVARGLLGQISPADQEVLARMVGVKEE
ncbi:MAG TPA: MarR family transcriptional regulator [Pseudohongiella sp.]|nr:MarR family transcriptional regulator [Pseudohongiella sp.]